MEPGGLATVESSIKQQTAQKVIDPSEMTQTIVSEEPTTDIAETKQAKPPIASALSARKPLPSGRKPPTARSGRKDAVGAGRR